MNSTRVVVLLSGRGSNLQAIVDETHHKRLPISIRAVISNNPQAKGLDLARAAGIETCVVDHRCYSDRTTFDAALIAAIDRFTPDLIVLAGFMRILGKSFIDHYQGRLMNIHPSLLPDFPGLNTHSRAIESGATRHGATVHFVTNEVDAGPVVVQAAVEVRPDETPESLAARVLAEEHRIYPLAIRWFAEGRLRIQDGEVLINRGNES